MPMTPFPKLCIGEGWPTDEETWVVRLRSPFLLARVEPRGLFGVRLHCWPPEARTATTDAKLTRCVARLGELWSIEVEHLEGMPSSWDYIFGGYSPPPYLVIDSSEAGWTGILETGPRRLWSVTEIPGADELLWIHEFSAEHPPQAADRVKVTEYWRNFCEAEDQLEK